MPEAIGPIPGWEGFDSPRYTPVPDDFFDVLLAELGDAEIRVLLYIMRRTFGWKKDADNISISQMVSGITTKDGRALDHGCGLVKGSVVRALNSLKARGIVVAQRNASKERGNEATTYTLRMKSSPLTPKETRVTLNESGPSLTKSQGLVSERDTQETVVQENSKQEGIAPMDLRLALIAFDKEIGGHNTWGQALERADALCAARGWSVATLLERLRNVRGATILARLATLE